MDPLSSASSGTFVTLSAVMLRLCEPFLDATAQKIDKIDTRYVLYDERLELRCDCFQSLILLSIFYSSISFIFEDILYRGCPFCRQLTAMNLSSEEVAAWADGGSKGATDGEGKNDEDNRAKQSQEATTSGNNGGDSVLSRGKPRTGSGGKNKYSFICECFFMTARVLNLGIIKAFSDFKHLSQVGKKFPLWSLIFFLVLEERNLLFF